jgi:hypothetical protein
MPISPQVCWLFSPIRSGSSITVYAAAAGLGWPVADEVFGPWDRTGTPYGYPRSHLDLIRAFKAAGEHLTRDVADLAERVFGEMAAHARAPSVLCKHPHASIGPEDVSNFWPEHRTVVLLRNPLFALNSLFVRRWDAATGGGSMLGYFSTIARRWLADPNRLVYDGMQQDPAGFFARVYEAWGLEATPDRLAGAVAYRAAHYHHSSKSEAGGEAGDAPGSVRSERAWAVPEAIVAEYLADPLMREVFAAAGWPTERDRYPRPTA